MYNYHMRGIRSIPDNSMQVLVISIIMDVARMFWKVVLALLHEYHLNITNLAQIIKLLH